MPSVDAGKRDIRGMTLTQRWPRLPGPVWTLIMWSVIGLSDALILAAWPTGPGPPSVGWLAVIGFEACTIVILLACGGRTPARVLQLLLLAKIAVILAYATGTPNSTAALTASPNLTVAVVYAAYWWHGAISYLVVAVSSLGFLLVIIITRLVAELGASWLILTSLWLVLAAALNTMVAQSQRQLTRDHLTGLLNRVGLERYVALHPQAGRTDIPRTMIAIDLDGFKRINDRQGHAAGDRTLQLVAQAWVDTLRADDLAVRIGGDEFLLILPKSTLAEAHGLVQRLRRKTPVEWSCGITDWAVDEPFEDALARADALMYANKRARGHGTSA